MLRKREISEKNKNKVKAMETIRVLTDCRKLDIIALSKWLRRFAKCETRSGRDARCADDESIEVQMNKVVDEKT